MRTGEAINDRTATRAEIRREWSLLNAADLIVISLESPYNLRGYLCEIETAGERRAIGAGETIAAALRDARERLGYIEENGQLVAVGQAVA